MEKFTQFLSHAAYIAVFTQETEERLLQKKPGRAKKRYNIIQRITGEEDITVIENITFNQLQGYRSIAEKQGTKIW